MTAEFIKSGRRKKTGEELPSKRVDAQKWRGIGHGTAAAQVAQSEVYPLEEQPVVYWREWGKHL